MAEHFFFTKREIHSSSGADIEDGVGLEEIGVGGATSAAFHSGKSDPTIENGADSAFPRHIRVTDPQLEIFMGHIDIFSGYDKGDNSADLIKVLCPFLL